MSSNSLLGGQEEEGRSEPSGSVKRALQQRFGIRGYVRNVIFVIFRGSLQGLCCSLGPSGYDSYSWGRAPAGYADAPEDTRPLHPGERMILSPLPDR